jgi:hypothetical protein
VQILQYIESLLIFERVQQAATSIFSQEKRLPLLKERLQIGTVGAHFRAKHHAKKRVATGMTSRRIAGQNGACASRANEVIWSAFDRARTVHTTARKNEIEGGFDPVF